MTIRKRVGIALIAFAVAGAWTVPALAAEEPTPVAEATPAPAPDVVKTAAPVAKVVKPRVVKRYWRHRPIRVASATSSWGGNHRWAVSHVILGVGF
jgi:hypothetical protein